MKAITKVEWWESHRLLRVVFACGALVSTTTTYDGGIDQSVHQLTPDDLKAIIAACLQGIPKESDAQAHE